VKPIILVRSTLTFAISTALLAGCSLFHHKDNYYSKAQETKPLEVPPDLDAPPTSNELTVPAPGSAGAAASTTTSTGSAPPQVSPGGDSLHVADSVGHAWARVGLALERAQVGTISERNETAHSYTLDVEGLKASAPATPAEHHWYTRIMHPFGGGSGSASSSAPAVSGHLTVTVAPDGDGARVEVSGASGDTSAAEAARRVLNALRERLS
jgi:uncharacterized lipoprotein